MPKPFECYKLQVIILSIALLCLPLYVNANILAIHSYHAEHIWTGFIKQGIDESFNNQEGEQLFHEYLDAKRYPKTQHKDHFLNYLTQKYSHIPPDVILVSDDAALQLIRDYRESFFRDIPIIYMGINQVTQKLINTPNMSGVFENRNLAKTVFDIKKITASDELIIITDRSAPGIANLSKIKAIENNVNAPNNIFIIDNLSDDKIISTLQNFKATTPVLLIGQMTTSDQSNALISWNKGTKLITTLTSHPVFTIAITTLDYGATGADELYGNQHAKRASELAKLILKGTSIDKISPITQAQSQWIFDAQKIKKHGYEKDHLPADSLITNDDMSFYQTYKLMVWLVSAAFLISVLVIILLTEIIRRGIHTRNILAENEIRYKDLAEAGANIFWETDQQHNFNYISGDTDLVFSKEANQITGHTLAELFDTNSNIDFPWGDYEQQLATLSPINNIIFKIKSDSDDVRIFLLNGDLIKKSNSIFSGYRGICKEITEEHLLSQKLAYQASYDSLTGLINRTSFNSRLKNYVEQQHNLEQESFICFLDLDRFKLVNDTAGHLIGDSMLAEIALLIHSCIGSLDILGRLSGDEFGLIVINQSQTQAQALCEKIITEINEYKFHWNHRYFNVGISIGMVPITHDLTEIELLSKADLSCYKAKELGRGRVYIADLNNDDLYKEELQMGYIVNVAQAIEQNQFYLVKQPINLTQDKTFDFHHYEILIRYKDEQGNIISPSIFIPAAEKYSVITLIDQWVITTVFDNYKTFFPSGNTMVSINLSGISLSNEDFVNNLTAFVKSSTISPHLICFEITETAAISHLSHALTFIQQMKTLGIKFALDDFGSGVSSFGYLKNIPVDYLKIDGSLIQNIITEPTDRAIVKSIHAIAKMMGIKTIAEFVENKEIHTILEDIGVDYVQGYAIGMPTNCCDKNQESREEKVGSDTT